MYVRISYVEEILESRDGYLTISVSMKDDRQASKWASYSEVSMSTINNRQSVVDYSTVHASMINSKSFLLGRGVDSNIIIASMAHTIFL